ncbi:hypothetical protein BC940DRAFT_312759 [Gongronella butleri]|nr:hypothetical protein BC940DRAFT_312759 [Gongronella butleri]
MDPAAEEQLKQQLSGVMKDELDRQRLREMQQREQDILAETRALQGDSWDEDDDSDDERRRRGSRLHLARPSVPDQRFEKQFERSVNALKEQGASRTTIFLSAVVKDQVIMPFINGFVWCIAGHAWRWYRMPRGQRKAAARESSSFLRGIKHGVGRWFSNAYHTLVHWPALIAPPSSASNSPSNYPKLA